MSEAQQLEAIVTKQDVENFKRLDQFLASKFPNISRSSVKHYFESGFISATLANKPAKLELKKIPLADTIIKLTIPKATPLELEPQELSIELLYQDEHLAIIVKPAGMVTHPAPGHEDGTLVNAILFHCKDLQAIGDKIRPGIVHRLDKGTSGVMVVAKNQTCHEKLVEMFSVHNLQRKYLALVKGRPNAVAGKIESQIGRHPNHRQKMSTKTKNGRNAITHYRVLWTIEGMSLIEFTLETGRTHQIRVHASEILQTPIIGDSLYARSYQTFLESTSIAHLLKDYPHPLLHAKLLAFNHPMTNQPLTYEADLPSPFKDVVRVLEETKK